VIGIASGPHSVGRVVCCLLGEDYEESGYGSSTGSSFGNYESSAVNSKSVSKPPKEVPSSSKYPEFSVGELTPVENGASNILPITNLGCSVDELYLGIRRNGKQLEFRRSVIQNGFPRTEVQSFALPFPINQRTCTATYFPTKNGGELVIRLGKNSPTANNQNELQVSTFRVYAAQTAKERVAFEIDQKSDFFAFNPVPSKYDTDITVVVIGSKLEFRTTFSYPEKGIITTINGKQTVNLPFIPRIDQFEIFTQFSGVKSVKIWHSRSDEDVSDCDVQIALG